MTPISTVEEKTINSFVGSIIIIELQPKLFTSLRMCDICVYSNRIAVALFHHLIPIGLCEFCYIAKIAYRNILCYD